MHNQVKTCAVITGDNLDRFLVKLERAQALVDFVELRVDYINNINDVMLTTIARHTNKQAILCCRALEDGGHFTGTLQQQRKILQQANDLGFDFIDIDLAKADKVTINAKKAKHIISYHNFDFMPPFDQLCLIKDKMRQHNPDIFKFAIMAQDAKDCNTLYNLLLNKKADESMIAVGMGEAGKITRLLTPLLGGYLTFASIDDSTSAPGQIDIKGMSAFYQNLNTLLGGDDIPKADGN